MSTYRLQGWALIFSAILSLFGLVWATFLHEPGSTLITILLRIGSILFILGLSAIQVTQPQTGRFGQVGLLLMAIGALIALIVTSISTPGGSGLGDTLPFISALCGLIGSLIVGWLTIRTRVFPAWVGWLLILGTVCNVLGDVYSPGILFFTIISILASAAALIGYGLQIIQQSIPRLQGV